MNARVEKRRIVYRMDSALRWMKSDLKKQNNNQKGKSDQVLRKKIEIKRGQIKILLPF